MKRLLLSLILMWGTAWHVTHAQSHQTTVRLADPKAVTELAVDVAWGNLTVEAYAGEAVLVEAFYTPQGGETMPAEPLRDFVRIEETNQRLSLRGRTPQGFESIDVVVQVPEHMTLHLRIRRGGEIQVTGMNALVEVDHRNGSVVLEALGGPALVKAVNGSITASFSSALPEKPMSFVTLNGGIDLTFPEHLQADVWLRTTRNGHIVSDFDLIGVDYPYAGEPAEGGSKPRYSAYPIAIQAPINGGGPLLVASTENGPIRLRQR